MNATTYDEQAEKFLADNGIKFRATLSDTKTAPWAMAEKPCKTEPHHYRVTLSKRRKNTHQHGAECECVTCCPVVRLTFDFWGSINDAQNGVDPSAYDVLACISSDATCPDTFKYWCGDFGESEDSIRALQTYRRCHAFAKRLQAFFTAAELEQLQTIN